MTRHLLFSSLLLLPLAAGSRGTELRTDLRYGPEAGTKITRTFTNPGGRTLSSMKLVLGDDEHPAGEMEMTETFDEKLVLEDEIVAVAPAPGDAPWRGRTTKLKRTFAELSQTSTEKSSMGERQHEETTDRKSDLAGATVVFTWDGEKEEYETAFDGESGKSRDAALLEELEADVDLAGFLPGKAVSDGDEWSVDMAAFKAGILRPAGELDFHGDEPRSESEKKARHDMWEAIRGEVHAHFRGTREQDGARLAVIELKAEISGEIEIEPEGKSPHARGTSVTFTQEFEGELLWDLGKNLARSYKLEARGKLATKTRLELEMGDEKLEGLQEAAFEVAETYEAVFAAEE